MVRVERRGLIGDLGGVVNGAVGAVGDLLVGGGDNGGGSQPSSAPAAPASTPAPAPAPAPAPSPSSTPSSGGSGSSGNSGSSSGGSSSGGSSSGGSPSGGSSSGGSSSSGSSGGGSSPASSGGNTGSSGSSSGGGNSGSSASNGGSNSNAGGNAQGGTPSSPSQSSSNGSGAAPNNVGAAPGTSGSSSGGASSNASGSSGSSGSAAAHGTTGAAASGSPTLAASGKGTTAPNGSPVSLAALSETSAVSGGNGNGVPSGGSSTGNGGGGSGGSTDGTHNSSGSAAHKGLSGGAIAGIVTLVIALTILTGLVVLRQRYRRRKNQQRVNWINGLSQDMPRDGDLNGDMVQRESFRSSWGNFEILPRPQESNGRLMDLEGDIFAPLAGPMLTPVQENGEDVYSPPRFPSPASSPTHTRATSPEDPFADLNAAMAAEGGPRSPAVPIKRMSVLPIRVSIISSSNEHDPFEDPRPSMDNRASLGSLPPSPAGDLTPRAAYFPMPPTTPKSDNQSLRAPDILLTFPDSPISPGFASLAGSATSYPRRASVTRWFRPNEARPDEVHVEQGDDVNVISVYEDGWAFIQRRKDSERGLVPLSCLTMLDATTATTTAEPMPLDGMAL